jgi:hypothetical protein
LALPDKATGSDNYGTPYQNERPVEDPTTEPDAGAINEALVDIAGCTRTIVRARVRFPGLTYTSGTQSIPITSHDAVWGSDVGVAPVVTQSATGIYLITWPTTVDDELGDPHTLNIGMPLEPVTIDAALSRVKVTAFTANTISLAAFDAAGAANALNGIPIFVAWI